MGNLWRWTASISAGTTNYAYAGFDLSQELDSSGNVLARYAQGDQIDQPLALSRAGVSSYFQTDGLGTVTSLSDSAGALARTYSYDAFGNTLNSTGTIGNAFEYTAREFDQETGLYLYRARYYDANTDRFLSEDPLGFDSSTSDFYSYTSNSPTNLVDPSGMSAAPSPSLPAEH